MFVKSQEGVSGLVFREKNMYHLLNVQCILKMSHKYWFYHDLCNSLHSTNILSNVRLSIASLEGREKANQ